MTPDDITAESLRLCLVWVGEGLSPLDAMAGIGYRPVCRYPTWPDVVFALEQTIKRFNSGWIMNMDDTRPKPVQWTDEMDAELEELYESGALIRDIGFYFHTHSSRIMRRLSEILSHEELNRLSYARRGIDPTTLTDEEQDDIIDRLDSGESMRKIGELYGLKDVLHVIACTKRHSRHTYGSPGSFPKKDFRFEDVSQAALDAELDRSVFRGSWA